MVVDIVDLVGTILANIKLSLLLSCGDIIQIERTLILSNMLADIQIYVFCCTIPQPLTPLQYSKLHAQVAMPDLCKHKRLERLM